MNLITRSSKRAPRSYFLFSNSILELYNFNINPIQKSQSFLLIYCVTIQKLYSGYIILLVCLNPHQVRSLQVCRLDNSFLISVTIPASCFSDSVYSHLIHNRLSSLQLPLLKLAWWDRSVHSSTELLSHFCRLIISTTLVIQLNTSATQNLALKTETLF